MTANAVHVMRIATGEITEAVIITSDGKNAAAAALGRKGGLAVRVQSSLGREAEVAMPASH